MTPRSHSFNVAAIGLSLSLTCASACGAASGAACGGAPPPPVAPPPARSAEPPPTSEVSPPAPPPLPPIPPFHFPRVTWAELPNGLRIATIQRKGSPVTALRVVVDTGSAADGERTGVSALTAELVLRGIPTPDLGKGGTPPHARADFDATELRLTVDADHLAQGVALLGAAFQRPPLAPAELDKLKAAEAARINELARTDAAWTASMVMFKDLFALPSEQHPYAAWGATATEVARVSVADCRGFHRRYYVPKNTVVIVAGDVAPDAVRALVQKAFGAPAPREAPPISFTDPTPPERRRITLIDRPKASEVELFVGALGPARSDPSFASFALAAQLVGAGLAGAAWTARSTVVELAHGPSMLLVRVGTENDKATFALQGMLARLHAVAARTADEDEIEAAKRALMSAMAPRLESTATLADEAARLLALGLAEDDGDAYWKELRDGSAALALKAASEHLRAGREAIVATGDAALLGPVLARFGEVKVVDATRDFARVRTIPMDTSAALEASSGGLGVSPNETARAY